MTGWLSRGRRRIVPAPGAESMPNRPRVLLVENDLDDRERIVPVLDALGFAVDIAVDAEAGLQQEGLREYAGAIVDLNLSSATRCEGFGLIAELRALGRRYPNRHREPQQRGRVRKPGIRGRRRRLHREVAPKTGDARAPRQADSRWCGASSGHARGGSRRTEYRFMTAPSRPDGIMWAYRLTARQGPAPLMVHLVGGAVEPERRHPLPYSPSPRERPSREGLQLPWISRSGARCIRNMVSPIHTRSLRPAMGQAASVAAGTIRHLHGACAPARIQ